jgi:hypothetical protein
MRSWGSKGGRTPSAGGGVGRSPEKVQVWKPELVVPIRRHHECGRTGMALWARSNPTHDDGGRLGESPEGDAE